jgi:anti-sigma factor RsiW
MTHPTTEDLFALYDGELAGEAARTAAAHVTQCQACAAALDGWKRTAGAAFVRMDAPVSEVMVTRVMRSLQAAPPRAARPAVWLRWLAPALGVAGLVLAVTRPFGAPVDTEHLLLAGGGVDDTWELLMEEAP